MIRTAPAPLGRLRPMRAFLLGTVFAGLAIGSASAETLSVTGITQGTSGSVYELSVPSVEVVDGNINEGAVRGLFTGAPGALDALATLNAKSLTIPEIKISYPSYVEGAGPSTVTYRDITLTDVTNGVAAAAHIGGADFSGAESVTGTFGEMSVGRFDLAAMLGFYGLTTAPAAGTEMKEVYTDFKFSGGSLKAGDVFNCTFGTGELGGFSARPLQHNFAEVNNLVMEAEAAQKAGTEVAPETVDKLVRFYADMFTAFSSTPMTFTGFDCSGKDEKGNPLTVASGPITIGGFEPAIYPAISLDDFDMTVENDGFLKFGNFTWKKMDFTAAVAAIEAAAKLDEAYFTANWRKLVPALDGMSLADLSIDVPDPEAEGKRITGTLGAFDATLGNYVNGIPADIALSLSNFILPITAEMTDLPVADLLARGVDQLDISLGTKLAWDQASSTIKVDDVLIDMGALGRVNLSGTFGNATEALFGDNTDQATLAAMMLTLRDVTIEVEDRGMGSLAFAAGAKEAGQSEASFRTAVAGMAQGMTLAFLGNTTEALTAAQQLGTFLNGASHLKLTITSKDEAGIGLADLAAAETNPAALAGKLNVVAEASGEPVELPVLEAPAPSTQDEKRDLKAPAAQ
ncbi:MULTISPECIES: hypothetical protein [unclassified Devosia]|jgi:hypothetical protein|uniref:hypothetical protein n=1 Tax=unclassified Devosia TaxID=196773 RepID=UPI00086DEAA8|nr:MULTISPECIES: hypothetical protein [unclassified Devosia]MBN9363959.1 hypothetical protein [Devosia sp.]ODS83387.1 MAG: hypothetical protein ABS47_20780 [Devosia sp. SCN 66-27]OJX27225.1 MAG: hypothetical protein BGO83_25895 [Devosia sp. 66-14]